MTRVCGYAGCGAKHYGSGWCSKHYSRVRRTGDPDGVRVGHRFQEVDAAERLRANSVKQGDCIVYTAGTPTRSGHRKMGYHGRLVGVHRVAEELANGPIPPRVVVRHWCDNPPCIKREHLRRGSVADNNRDRDVRGRHRPLPGSKNGNAKLTEYQVQEILSALVGGATTYALAERYGVHQGLIWLIRAGKAWRHVQRPEGMPEVRTYRPRVG